jgi:hypothetical protein
MNVVQIVKTFSAEERYAFVQYCASPYFKIRPHVQELFEVLIKHYPKVPRATELWRDMFSEHKPYNDATFRKIRSDLYQEVGRFLSFRAYESRMPGEPDLLRELQSRNLCALRKREHRRLKKHWAAVSQKGEHYYYRTTQLAYAGFAAEKNLSPEASEMAYLQMERSLDRYYLISKFRITINRLVHAGIFHAGEEPPAAEHLLSPEVVGKHLDDPVITIYYQLYNLYARGKEQLFPDLLRSLSKLHHAEPDERYEIGSHVLNFALRRANGGSFKYMKFAFKVYEALMENGNFLLGGKLGGHRFTTVVRYGLAMGKRKFVRKFIREYGDHVAGDQSEEYRALARATYSFYEGNYQEALNNLPETERKQVFLDLSIRLLRLRILYEMRDEEVENVYGSLKIKVHRVGKQNYMASEYLDCYRRIVSVMGKLLRVEPDSDGQDILVEAGDLPAELGKWVTKMVVLRKRYPQLR